MVVLRHDQAGGEEPIISAKEDDIWHALAKLARKQEEGHSSELIHWVVPNELACCHRPLRFHPLYGGSGKIIPREASCLVEEWAQRVRRAGIQSIIPLLHSRELRYYHQLDLGADNLIAFYQLKGFVVAHLPWDDPAHSGMTDDYFQQKLKAIRSEALAAFERLPKPVLVHCSAGIDRTPPVAAYIFCKAS